MAEAHAHGAGAEAATILLDFARSASAAGDLPLPALGFGTRAPLSDPDAWKGMTFPSEEGSARDAPHQAQCGRLYLSPCRAEYSGSFEQAPLVGKLSSQMTRRWPLMLTLVARL